VDELDIRVTKSDVKKLREKDRRLTAADYKRARDEKRLERRVV